LVGALLIVSGALVHVAAQAQNQTPFRLTLVVPPNSLNLLTTVSAGSGSTVADLEYVGASPTLFPNGSQDWQSSDTNWITSNSNYTVWMFHVKPGLRWSDGENATANDILATFGPNFALNASYDIWGIHNEVAKEYALNSSTAVFNLNVSDAHLPEKLGDQVFTDLYSASFVNNQGVTSPNFGTDVGEGPFYVSNYTAGQFQMTLLRNPYFYTTGLPEPKISQLNVNFVESLSSTATSLLSGSTDLAQVEPSNVASILKDPNLGVLDEKAWEITSLEYNDSMAPYNDLAFRQALTYAINDSQLVQQADSGYGQTAYNAQGLVTPSTTLWYNPNIQKYNYDQSHALQLLSGLGITKGSDNLLHYSNGTAVSLNLWTDTDNTADTVGAGVVQQDLQQLGFTVHLTTTSSANLVGDYSSGANGIRSGMILFTAVAYVPGMPFLEGYPGWDTIWDPTTANHYWLYPPSANDQYQGNFTAFQATANYTQEFSSFGNIQALNAQYLPTIVVAYPDIVYGYNKVGWTGWPGANGAIDFRASPWNYTMWATLSPLTGSSSTGATTTSGQTTSSSGLYTILLAGVLVVVLVVVGLAVYMRRRGRASGTGPSTAR
jgi:peptide/nickel transport system substrate-binding protein